MSEFSKYNPDSENTTNIQIPESDFELTFSSSSGKGGQNVNRRSTKATLRFNIEQSSLPPEIKQELFKKLANKLTDNGELVIFDQQERSQLQNKNRVIEKLHNIINEALRPDIERIGTKPTHSSQQRRIKEKVKHGRQKTLRKKIEFED